MDQKWEKYTWVCAGDCDALIEYTIKDGFGWPSGVVQLTCVCGSECILLSVADATINNNNEQKEEAPMITATPEFLTRQVEALTTLRENQDRHIESLQNQVSELSAKLGPSHTNCDYWKSENGRVQSQIIDLINDAYDNETDASEILITLGQIIDYTPTKTIEFTATISFSGSIEVPREEQDDFDLESVLEDAYVDINNGNVVIDNYELYDANEC